MDSKTLIKNLHQLFCKARKKNKIYSKVWLEIADFGGLYDSKKYILNVKAHHQIENHYGEIKDVLYLLDKEAKEELSYIWRVAVYHANEDVYSESNLVVYEEEEACP